MVYTDNFKAYNAQEVSEFHHRRINHSTLFSKERNHTNGLIRQYFPKNRDFRTITDSETIRAMKRLNNHPRKRLGCKTPNEVIFGESFKVALTT